MILVLRILMHKCRKQIGNVDVMLYYYTGCDIKFSYGASAKFFNCAHLYIAKQKIKLIFFQECIILLFFIYTEYYFVVVIK